MPTTQVERQTSELKQLKKDRGRKRDDRPKSDTGQRDREPKVVLSKALKCFRFTKESHDKEIRMSNKIVETRNGFDSDGSRPSNSSVVVRI